MKPEDIRRIREKFNMDRHQFAEFLCLAGYRSLMQIEHGTRNPAKFVIRFLRYLDSLPKHKALGLIEELNRHEPK